MQDKIEFYKEILDHDPHSSVFFPLAEMHRQAGQLEECAQVLTNGLQHHPQHFGAQSLLIEVLDELGRREEAEKSTRFLVRVLAQNARFWKIWAGICTEEGDHDLALAVNFIGNSIEGQALTWAQVLSRGISTLTPGGKPEETTEQETFEHREGARPPREMEYEEAFDDMEMEIEEEEEKDQFVEQAGDYKEVILGEEDTPRTRTMADLLAEQGDYQQALRIYRALLEGASDDFDREELEEIVQNLELTLAEIESGEEEQDSASEKQSELYEDFSSASEIEPEGEVEDFHEATSSDDMFHELEEETAAKEGVEEPLEPEEPVDESEQELSFEPEEEYDFETSSDALDTYSLEETPPEEEPEPEPVEEPEPMEEPEPVKEPESREAAEEREEEALEPGEKQPRKKKDKVVNVLEILAKRLEDRSK